MVSICVFPPKPSPVPSAKPVYRILAGKIYDSYERKLVENQVITVDKQAGIVVDVQPASLDTSNQGENEANVEVIDLRHLTVVPGFVDVHVHFFLHPYSETSWQDQLTKESLAERTVRATVHARRTLLAGFTTVRDLGTEGAFDADLALRKCMAGDNPIIPGPRYYCADRAIISTGAYGPKSSIYPTQEGIEGVTGAESADGHDACVRAVRRQIGAGADWIKIYADYRIRSRMVDVSQFITSQNLATFTKHQLHAMINTAHDLGVKVAAHANTTEVVKLLLWLGVDTIEHGAEMFTDDASLEYAISRFTEAKGRITWVPTLAAYYTISLSGSAETWTNAKRTFQKVVIDGGMDYVACGGDTGVFAHGSNGLEMILMRKLGAGWERVLKWATLGGWECVRGMEWEGDAGKERLRKIEDGDFNKNGQLGLERGVPFGAIRKGWAADLVGIEGDLDGGVDAFEKSIMQDVRFVMKGGRVYKEGGNPVLEHFL